MKKIIVLLLTCLSFNYCWGIDFDRIYLRDGSVLEGFISEQKMNGEIIITFVKATFTFPKEEALISVDGSTIKYRNEEYHDCKLIEDGDFVTFEVVPEIPDSKLSSSSDIVKTIRAVNELIEDVIDTRDEDRSYRGHITEVGEGKVKMLLNDGKSIVIRQNNIRQQRRVCKDGNNDKLLERSPLLETYVLKDGSKAVGLLISQKFQSGDIQFLSTDKFSYPWKIQNVSSVTRKINPNFKKAAEKEDTNYYVNDVPFKMATPHTDKDGVVSIKSLSLVGSAPHGVVTVRIPKSRDVENYVLLRFNPLTDYDKKTGFLRVASQIDILKNGLPLAAVKDNKTYLTLTYDLSEGYYVLYDKSTTMICPLWIY